MKSLRLLTTLGSLAAIAVAPLHAKESPEVPAAVLAAVHRAYPGAKIIETDTEHEDGKLVFEIEIKTDGHKKCLKYDKQATLLETEEVIKLDHLPAAVAAAYHHAAPKDTPLEVEKSESATHGVRYEIKAKGEMGIREFVFSESGSLISAKLEKHGDEEDDD